MLEALVADALADFSQVAAIAGIDVPLNQIRRQILSKPHKARTLPLGQMAIYAFFLDGRALKVGKVGPNSGPRFTYQHYSGSAQSTLRGSILSNPNRIGATALTPETAGEWIRAHTDRVDLLIPATYGIPFLSLLEAFLHVRWNPIFEGRLESD
jgi:hypothetical protein